MNAANLPKKIPAFGKLLLDEGLINEIQLRAGLTTCEKYGYRIGSALVVSGILDELTVTRMLTKHSGTDGVVVEQCRFKLDCLTLIPEDVALKKLALPLKLDSRSLTVAMASAKDIMLIDELSFMTGKRIVPLTALEKSLKDAIPYIYSLLKQGKDEYVGKQCQAEKEHIQLVNYKNDLMRSTTSKIKEELPPAEETLQPIHVETIPPMPVSLVDNLAEDRSTAEDIVAKRSSDPLPEKKQSQPPPEQPPLASPSLDQVRPTSEMPTILVVDADKLIQSYLADHLNRMYNVICSDDGQQATTILKKILPDLIILDGMLPGIHGFELCKSLKESPSYKDIPIIIISSKYSGWEFREDVIKQYGADEFMQKPFNLTELTKILQRLISQDKENRKEETPAEDKESQQKILLLLKEGKTEQALQICQQAITQDPLNAEYHYLLGILLEKQQKDFEAIESLEKAASLNPLHFNSLRKLAELYQKKNFSHKSIETWMRAANAAPSKEFKEKIKKHLIDHL